MIWIFGIWALGFVVCFIMSAYLVWRDGKFTLHDIVEYLPLCVGSWVTITCDILEIVVADKVFWERKNDHETL